MESYSTVPVMLRAVAISLGVLSLTVFATASPLDAQAQKPYDWRVYVKFKPHVKLNATVRSQLLRDLKASLGPALGDDLGRVSVQALADVPKEGREAIVQRFDDRGFEAIGLEEFRTLTGVKSHFLTVEVQDGKFLLQSGQHDGDCGLSTPQVRRQVVADQDLLSRIAGYMIAADFGPTGTVEPLADTKDACLLRVRGSELPGIARWVNVGDVFAFSVVLDQPRTMPKDAKAVAVKPGTVIDVPKDRKAQPRAATLLRVVAMIQPGVAKCEIFSMYEVPFPKSPKLVGYRAMKLATHDAPVRIALTDDAGKQPNAAVPLELWATEYGGLATKPTPRDTLDGRNGVYQSGRNMRGLAYVWVKLGNEKTCFVVPVLTSGAPNAIRFQFDEVAVRKARYADRVQRYANRVLETRLAQDQLGQSLKLLIEKGENKKALERAEFGLKAMDDEGKDLTAQLAALRTDPLAKDDRPARELAAADQLLQTLTVIRPELQAKRDELKLSLDKAENPAEYEKKFRANEITRLIAYHDRRGEIAEALDQYETLIELTQLEDAKARRAKLVQDSTTDKPEVQVARTAARVEWNTLETLEQIKAKLPEFSRTAETLGKADDKYGLRVVQTTIQASYARLGELLSTLDTELVQDKEQLKAIDVVKGDLQQLELSVVANRKRIGD